jgi:phosphoglycerol transferase MdoB-like AlkP superfamily enzyme
MPGIIKLLDSAGYKTSFWYGGDINFANINSFITTTGFRQKVTKDDFDPTDYNSKWGVHDEVLLNRLFDSLSSATQPFAYSALTLSSHEPFEVPMDPVFKGKDVLSMFKNSVYYTDKVLGEFIDKAKKSDWWKNTVIIIIADHCRRNSNTIPVYSEEIFRIPMLWTGGALEKNNITVNKYGNQFDLPLTLAGQLNLISSFPFSKDLLSAGSHSFSFYTYNDGFAFITDSATSIYDAKLSKNVFERGRYPASAEMLGKSFLQVLFDDYLKR